jgi:hypothetical protein
MATSNLTEEQRRERTRQQCKASYERFNEQRRATNRKQREARDHQILQTPPLELAYAAGIIDGEGCIGIHPRRDRRTFTTGIAVQMCEPDAILFLHQCFGGYLGLNKTFHRDRPQHRPQHVWSVANQQACSACRALAPYLRVKRQQALNVIELQEIHAKITEATRLQRKDRKVAEARKSKYQHDPTLLERCQQLYLHQRDLNRRGQFARHASTANPITANPASSRIGDIPRLLAAEDTLD